MRRLHFASKWGKLTLATLILALGLTALIVSPAPTEAAPTLLCGPTYQWSCEYPGCPSCPVVLFQGTVCEKNEFEKETGRVCSPI